MEDLVGAPQDYPNKTVRIIEPFGAGGRPDLLALALAPKLSALWGQQVIVENHPGAGGTAAPALVAKSPPDGHTLLLNTSAQAYTAALSNRPPYNALNDFIAVAALTTRPYVLVTGRPSGVSTLSELIAAAKTKPGALTFASAGVGTGTHLGAPTFNYEANIEAVEMPPQPAAGIAEVLAGTIEGRTTYMFAPISTVTLPAIRDGSLVALGVSTARRSSLLPDVPTITEAGVAGFDFPICYGIWGPEGTPAALLARLVKDIADVMATPDLSEWLAKHGVDRLSIGAA